MFIIKHWKRRVFGNKEPQLDDQIAKRKKKQDPKNFSMIAHQLSSTVPKDNSLGRIILTSPSSHNKPKGLVQSSAAKCLANKNEFAATSPALISSESLLNDRSSCKSSHQPCKTCDILVDLLECGVCLEPLQGKGTNSCPVCANLVCLPCAGKLKQCAYCRSTRPLERNQALERIIAKLRMPCKNYRSGCPMVLDEIGRPSHESLCNFQSLPCPIGSVPCGWQGTVYDIQAHIKSAHNLQPVNDHGVSLEIHNFRYKAKACDGRVYTICMFCYDRLFVIRIILFQDKLRMSLRYLGQVTYESCPESQKCPKYGVWLNIRPNNGDRLRGLIILGKNDRQAHDIDLSCDEIYNGNSKILFTEENHKTSFQRVFSKKCEGMSGDMSDFVKIDLLVKELNT